MTRRSWGLCVLLCATAALAHQPTISDGTETTADNAIVFDDIQLSRVVYHEITDATPRIWLTFDIDTPQDLLVQLGVPLIDRLASYRPAFALLGPGLPDAELPFDTPVRGARLITTDGVDEPVVFHEEFSGTSSWILFEGTIELPQPGTYYLVAYHPSDEPGKLWIAPGQREEFGLGDIAELSGILPEVRAFHEGSSGGLPCFAAPAGAGLLALCALGWMRRK